MVTWLRFVVGFLAVYRVAKLISIDEGPFGIFTKSREAVGAYDYDENGDIASNLGRGVVCPLCVGVWVSVLCAWLVMRPSKIGDWFLTWMGLAGAQTILLRLSEGWD